MSSLDDIIKQKADGHESPVPHGAWEKIMPQKKQRRFVFWLWTLAGLIIYGTGVVSYHLLVTGDRGSVTSDQRAVISDKKSVANDHGPVSSDKRSVTSDQSNVIVTTEKTGPELKEDNNAPATLQNENESNAVAASTPLAAHDRQRLRTRATTKLTIKPAEFGNEDVTIAPGSEYADKNKKITKQVDAKITMQITSAITGEEVASVNHNSVSKENEQGNPIKNESQQSTKTAITSTPAGSKKQDSSSAIKHQPETVSTTAIPKKEQIKYHGLYADISIMPFFPIQQTNTTVGFIRNSVNGNSTSEFTGNNISSKLEPSIAFSLQLRKTLGRRWDAGIGLQYAQLKQTVHLTGEETTITYSTVNRLVTEAGNSYLVIDTIATETKGTREINAVNSYRFISVPLFVQYKAGKLLGFDFSVTGGLFVNIYNSYSNSIDPLVTTTADPGKSKVGIDLYGGFRLLKQYGNRIALFAEPTARFNISHSPIKNSLLHKPIHQAGIAVGASLKLK